MNLETNLVTQQIHTDPLDELLYLASIPSSIEHKAGIKKIIRYVSDELESLGFQSIDFIRSLHPEFASALVADSNPDKERTIILVCHADTVIAPMTNKDFVIRGGRIVGPGVADNKGGIVVLLNALRNLPIQNLPFNLRVVVSANEELGSPGFNAYFKKLGKDASYVFGFEPSMPNGDIITQRNGNYWLEVITTGKEAHSGRCKGEELNIAHDFILKFNEILQRKEKYPNVKINIGSLQSTKDVFNIVCGELKAKIDFRYSEEKDFQECLQEVKEVFLGPRLINCDGNAGALHFTVHDHCPPLEKNKNIETHLLAYTQGIQQIEGRSIQLCFSGGASDTNYLSSPNSICADGFGPVGGNLHLMNEYVEITSLTTRAKAFSHVILHLGEMYGRNIS